MHWVNGLVFIHCRETHENRRECSAALSFSRCHQEIQLQPVYKVEKAAMLYNKATHYNKMCLCSTGLIRSSLHCSRMEVERKKAKCESTNCTENNWCGRRSANCVWFCQSSLREDASWVQIFFLLQNGAVGVKRKIRWKWIYEEVIFSVWTNCLS